MNTTPHKTPVTVLGIGNPIMGDDGVGIALLNELMSSEYERPVEFVDGGTIGMSLLPVVADSASLLVLDAVATGDPPGTVVTVSGDQLPRLLSSKLSPHQIGLLDVLTGVRLMGSEPDRITVVGVVPEYIDMRVGLSPAVASAMAEAVDVARGVLASWWAADD